MDSNMIDKLKAMLDDPATVNTLSAVLGGMMPGTQQKGDVKAENDIEIDESNQDSANIPPSPEPASDPTDMIMRIKEVMGKSSGSSDPRINLLSSLKPYMRPTRSAKMDQAIKLIQIAKIASVFKE